MARTRVAVGQTSRGTRGGSTRGGRSSPSPDRELYIIQIPGLEWVDWNVIGVRSVITTEERITFFNESLRLTARSDDEATSSSNLPPPSPYVIQAP